MLRPIILIGCGGSGQKAVRYVRDAVSRRLIHAGWENGVPAAWQFVGLDTLNTQEATERIPTLPASDYLSVSLDFSDFKGLSDALLAKFPKGSPGYREMMGWRPNPDKVHVPLKAGAGQMRAIGRSAGALSLESAISKRIMDAFGQTDAGGPELQQVSEKLMGTEVPPGTATPEPLVMVLGSMAGGTGSGIMLDVIDLIRRLHPKGKYPIAVVFSTDIFGTVANSAMAANGLGFMSELLSAYWDNEHADAALIPGIYRSNTRGPHATFIIGRKNIDGLDLKDSLNVYRAVGETLAAVTTSNSVQEEFYNFVTVNWASDSPSNAGGYGLDAASEERLPGALSSFGSATLSIGRDRFSNYSSKLLQRTILEFLANGFTKAAFNEWGDQVSKMPAVAQQEKLVERFLRPFMDECRLLERGEQDNQFSEVVSSDSRREDLIQRASQLLKSGAAPSKQAASAWWTLINSSSSTAKKTLSQENEEWTTKTLNEWATNQFALILEVSTKYAATVSLPVLSKLLEKSQTEVAEVAGEVRQIATKLKNNSVLDAEKAQRGLQENQKGELGANHSAVESAFKLMAQSIAKEVNAASLERVATAMESLATSVLQNLNAQVRQTLGKVQSWVSPQEGQPSLVAGWPTNDKTVPPSFAPSPVEFFLEEYTDWPSRIRGLILDSLTAEEKASGDPIDIARTMIIRGAYGSKGTGKVAPLFWSTKSGDGGPRWSIGTSMPEIETDIDHLEDRVTFWLKRSGTELQRFFSEGLQSYLREVDSNGQPVVNHIERLQNFKQKLQEALQQSRPLFELDKAMYATVHKKHWDDFKLNIQGFPFPEGHPAREITEQVITGFGGSDAALGAFNSSESESVLISSLLRYPINPSVVTSFTQPLTQAWNATQTEAQLQSSFWRWRRSRILENFVPLPDELRRAAIRGFAIGRMIGYITAETSTANRISGLEQEFEFPKWLLTPVSAQNLLPALLESMVLCFKDAPLLGKEAFAAYRELIALGVTADSSSESFELFGDCLEFIKTGKLLRVPVDAAQAEKMNGSSSEERQAKMIKYLNSNLKRYVELQAKPPTNQHWREEHGAVVPQETLSLELIDDLISSYGLVLKAVENALDEEVEI